MGYITVSIGLQRGAVAVEAHKAEWEAAAKKTIELLKSILKNDAVDIRHVGSTAVKSICAKPIIDIAVGVRSFDDVFAHNDKLQKHGIAYRREDHPGQHLYVCADDKNNLQTHYIHIVIYNGEDWNNYVNLCDYLNSEESAANEYQVLSNPACNNLLLSQAKKNQALQLLSFLQFFLPVHICTVSALP